MLQTRLSEMEQEILILLFAQLYRNVVAFMSLGTNGAFWSHLGLLNDCNSDQMVIY
jgi:hypothetical protein